MSSAINLLYDPWAIGRAAACGDQLGTTKETQAASASLMRCPWDLSAPKIDLPPGLGPLSSLGPLKDPHYKEVKEPVQYTGVTSAWLDWSARFRRYVVSRTDVRIAVLLDSIEQLRGRPVTADDEAGWETKLNLLPGIEAWKEQLH